MSLSNLQIKALERARNGERVSAHDAHALINLGLLNDRKRGKYTLTPRGQEILDSLNEKKC